MKNKQIVDSWDNINPDSAADARMLNAILSQNSSSGLPRQASRGLTRRLALVAIVVILTLTATAFAVAHYLGSFDRLREIVGDERIDMLQPVQIGSIVTNTGLSVELVAVAVSSNVLDLYLTVEDLVSNRLDGDFHIAASVRQVGDVDLASVTRFSDVISRTDNGTVTLHKRAVFIHPIAGQELEFSLHEMSYNYRSSELAVDFDLSESVEHTPAAQLWDTPILTPHLHDIGMALEGFENAGSIRISSIGIINGRLHVQEQFDQVAMGQWPANGTSLIDPQGEVVYPLRGTRDNTATISFGIDDYGNIFNDRGHNFATFPLRYRENIFEVDLKRLAEYQLVTSFNAYDRLWLDWSVRFEIDVPDVVGFLGADELNILIERYSSTIEKVQISPYSVLLSGFQGLHNEYPECALLSLFGIQVRLNMADGTVIYAERGWSRFSDFETRIFTEIMSVDVERIDLDAVLSIEIDGYVIEFR